MFKASEAVAISLHAMTYIANRENQICSLKEIAEKFNISDHHLSKILQRFVKLGILKSAKGPKGGFSIVSKYKDTTFLEIYEIIEGRIIRHDCIFNSDKGNCSKCIMNNMLKRMNDEFIEYMKNHKISDFAL